VAWWWLLEPKVVVCMRFRKRSVCCDCMITKWKYTFVTVHRLVCSILKLEFLFCEWTIYSFLIEEIKVEQTLIMRSWLCAFHGTLLKWLHHAGWDVNMENVRNTSQILAGESEGYRLFGRPSCTAQKYICLLYVIIFRSTYTLYVAVTPRLTHEQ
jgi:hypothetical protein